MTSNTIYLKKSISFLSGTIKLKSFNNILLFSWWFTKNIEKQINKTPKAIKTNFKISLLKSLSTAVDEDVDTKNSLYVTIVNKKFKKGKKMIEPLLCGIVLGLVPITLLGLFVSAWNQYRRGSGMLDID